MDLNVLQDLSHNYGISLELANLYKDRLLLCPLFEGDEESLLECLEEFIAERTFYELHNQNQPIDYSYSKVLYGKFGNRSLPYLSDSYKDLYKILYDDKYLEELFKEESTFEEEIYDYHGINNR